MRHRVTLTFLAEVDELAAWDIAEGLERAAAARGFVAVSALVDPDDSDRGLVDVGSQQVPVLSAVREVPSPGEGRSAIVPDGRPSLEDPAVGPRRFGEPG